MRSPCKVSLLVDAAATVSVTVEPLILLSTWQRRERKLKRPMRSIDSDFAAPVVAMAVVVAVVVIVVA